ncbi:IclR family transcriptional regulator [Deinococcus aquiradiocola]|uniref:Transcriptional regulator n=1 Tax=Deinococcus aquiradiocola TaxID=393059 RepID=A0A917PCJ4_9DEIO|nr:IclR family transcriptional regulator [Deinococcus aquiradiocola]GGJ70883.1 transcriptional regulator [Deinococcus aquiradiocola]
MSGVRPGRRQQAEASPVRTLERGLLLLRVLGEAPGGRAGLTLSELARAVDLPASTAFRLLQTLRAQGFAHLTDDGHWLVGAQAFVTGSAYLERGGPQERLIRTARPGMDALAAQLGETVNLAVLWEGQVMYLAQSEGRGLLRMFTHVGARAPLHCTGAGKVLLAWSGQPVPAGPYPAFTPHTLTDAPALERHLTGVREQGFALDDEERELGVRCLAVPVWGRAGGREGGRVLASLSVSAPASRLDRAQVPALAETLAQAARDVTARLS